MPDPETERLVRAVRRDDGLVDVLWPADTDSPNEATRRYRCQLMQDDDPDLAGRPYADVAAASLPPRAERARWCIRDGAVEVARA